MFLLFNVFKILFKSGIFVVKLATIKSFNLKTRKPISPDKPCIANFRGVVTPATPHLNPPLNVLCIIKSIIGTA